MRIVLDTNQLVRALARPPEFATFVMAWASARFTVLCSDELLDEYEHVLSRPYIRALVYPESLRAFRSYLLDVTYLYIVHKKMRTLTTESIIRWFRGSRKPKI